MGPATNRKIMQGPEQLEQGFGDFGVYDVIGAF